MNIDGRLQHKNLKPNSVGHYGWYSEAKDPVNGRIQK